MLLLAASASSKEPDLKANQHHVWSLVPHWLSVHSVGLPVAVALGCPPDSGFVDIGFWKIVLLKLKAGLGTLFHFSARCSTEPPNIWSTTENM